MNNRFFPKYTAIAGGALTGIICVIMNAFLIPAIESDTQGIRCFDMSFLAPYEDGAAFLSLIGDEGRFIYLHRQIPLDFVYPVVYTLFFVSLFFLMSKGKIRAVFCAASFLLAAFDFAENIMSIVMLKNGIPSESFYYTATAVTAVKTILMYLIFAALIILLIKIIKDKLGNRGKGEKENAD